MIDSVEIPPTDGTEESDNEEEQDDDARAKEQLEVQEGGEAEEKGLQSIFEKLYKWFPFLSNRGNRAGLVHNFLRELQVSGKIQYAKTLSSSCAAFFQAFAVLYDVTIGKNAMKIED